MKKIDLEETTRKIFRFRPNEAYTIEEVLGQFRRWRAEAFQCRRGEVCLKSGAPAREFLVVGSGQLHVKQPSELGDDVLVRVAGPGDYVGLPLIYSQAKGVPFDVVAASEAEIVLFNVDEVRKWRTDPKSQPLFDFIGRLMGEVINESQTRVMILCGQDIAERLRRWLVVQMERNHTHTVAVPGTCAALAKYLGVSRFALSRTIRRLQAEGKLEFRRNVFTVAGCRRRSFRACARPSATLKSYRFFGGYVFASLDLPSELRSSEHLALRRICFAILCRRR